jgi:hypothetical protein
VSAVSASSCRPVWAGVGAYVLLKSLLKQNSPVKTLIKWPLFSSGRVQKRRLGELIEQSVGLGGLQERSGA